MTSTQLREEHLRERPCDPPKVGCAFYDKMRKVSFSHQVLIFEVDSDNQDRKGIWEKIGRDRERFKRRIEEVEQKIGWLFNL